MMFSKVSEFIYEKTRKIPGVKPDDGIVRSLVYIQPSCDVSDEYKKFETGRIGMCLLILTVGLILSLFLKLSAFSESDVGDGVFERDEWNGSRKPVSLIGHTESETVEVDLNIHTRTLSEEETDNYIAEFIKNADRLIGGENPDLMHVSSDLVLKEKYDGYPFKFVWRSSDPYMIASYSGKVDLSEGAGDVTLTAYYSYGDYEGTVQIPVHTEMPERDPSERYAEGLRSYLQESEESDRGRKEWSLPDEYSGEKISWEYKAEDNSMLLAGVFTIVSIVVFFASGKDLASKAEKKKENMRMSYPKVLRQLALYVGAGMTVKGAFIKIAEDSRNMNKDEFIYEEMRFACREMSQGLGEASVYERFGNRTGLSEYIKLAGLLAQNLKRGNTGFVMRLRSEADNAMRERVLEARKAGEMAQTKLLAPMMMMLAVVMVMIMIPAMTGMNF
ncbi:MAG: type II secretion system F family protein [Lachnospiraceae bacterium]|nr:type II secretion system F family protein [Lachnospiraceae bacterium]